MSALPCSSMPSVSRRYAVTRGAPGGSDSTRSPSSSVRRCFSPASWRWRPRASTRSTSETSGGVSRQAWPARSMASRVAPARCRRCRRGVERVRRAASSCPVVARARWRARRCSSATRSASLRCTSRFSSSGACFWAAAASSGWAGRTRSPSTTTTPASTAAWRAAMTGGLRQLGDAQVGVERERQQHAAGGVVEVGDAQAEQVLDVVGHGQVARGCRGRAPPACGPSPARRAGCPSWCRRSAAGGGGGAAAPAALASSCRVAPRLIAPTVSRSACWSAKAFSSAERRPGRRASRKATGSRSSRRAAYAKRVLGRPVEPLHVVDGDEQRAGLRQRAQGREHGDRDDLRLRAVGRSGRRGRAPRRAPGAGVPGRRTAPRSPRRRAGRSARRRAAASRPRSTARPARACRARAPTRRPAPTGWSCRRRARPPAPGPARRCSPASRSADRLQLALPCDQPSHGGHDVSLQARRAAHSWARTANANSLPHAPLKNTFSTKCASRRNPTRSSRAAADGVQRVGDGDDAVQR